MAHGRLSPLFNTSPLARANFERAILMSDTSLWRFFLTAKSAEGGCFSGIFSSPTVIAAPRARRRGTFPTCCPSIFPAPSPPYGMTLQSPAIPPLDAPPPPVRLSILSISHKLIFWMGVLVYRCNGVF